MFLLLLGIGVGLYFMGYIPGTKKYILKKGGYENLKRLVNNVKKKIKKELTPEEEQDIADYIKRNCDTFDGKYLKKNYSQIEKEVKKLEKGIVDTIGKMCGS